MINNEIQMPNEERIQENLDRLRKTKSDSSVISDYIVNNCPSLVNLAHSSRETVVEPNSQVSTKLMHAQLIDESVRRFKDSVERFSK